tara:strand:+ start:21834 stop:23474 length:1641 start_codon:yes stop_codon:yes gene_type:complete
MLVPCDCEEEAGNNCGEGVKVCVCCSGTVDENCPCLDGPTEFKIGDGACSCWKLECCGGDCQDQENPCGCEKDAIPFASFLPEILSCEECCDEDGGGGGGPCEWGLQTCCPEIPKAPISLSVNVSGSYISLGNSCCPPSSTIASNCEDSFFECFGKVTYANPLGGAPATDLVCQNQAMWANMQLCADSDTCSTTYVPQTSGSGVFDIAPQTAVPNCDMANTTCCTPPSNRIFTNYFNNGWLGPYQSCPPTGLCCSRGMSAYGVNHEGYDFEVSIDIPCDPQTGRHEIRGRCPAPLLKFGHICNAGTALVGNCPSTQCSWGGSPTPGCGDSYSCGSETSRQVSGTWRASVGFEPVTGCSYGKIWANVSFTPDPGYGFETLTFGNTTEVYGPHPCAGGAITGVLNEAAAIEENTGISYTDAVKMVEGCGMGHPALKLPLNEGLSDAVGVELQRNNLPINGEIEALAVEEWCRIIDSKFNKWEFSTTVDEGPNTSKGMTGCIPNNITSNPNTNCDGCIPPGGGMNGGYIYDGACTPKRAAWSHKCTISY